MREKLKPGEQFVYYETKNDEEINGKPSLFKQLHSAIVPPNLGPLSAQSLDERRHEEQISKTLSI